MIFVSFPSNVSQGIINRKTIAQFYCKQTVLPMRTNGLPKNTKLIDRTEDDLVEDANLPNQLKYNAYEEF